MTASHFIRLRLASQRIAHAPFARPEEAVAWSGVMQAQDGPAARAAVGLRCQGVTEADVTQALNERRIVRTWALRGTLQLVAAQDLHWLLALAAPGVLARAAGMYRQQGVKQPDLAPHYKAMKAILQGGKQLTRAELFAALQRRKVDTTDFRGAHLMYCAAATGLICQGVMKVKQETFTLLADWLPAPARPMKRDDALAELALRYFRSHGPATPADFTWWAGLTAGDARKALEMAEPKLPKEPALAKIPASVLLPAFDEYLLGYRDRTQILDPEHASKALTPNGLFRPTLLLKGRVAGTWAREVKKDKLRITLHPFAPLTKAAQRAAARAARDHGKFMNLPVELLPQP